jgi:tetrahydromethanopterin S-methyltransferase subunit G
MDKSFKVFVLSVTVCVLLFSSPISLFASDGFTKEDRELLITLKVKMEQIDKRFEEIDKRFQQIDKRFEQIDKRFEQIDKRIGEIITFMWMLVVIFSSITAATIGFAIWDRRTMIRPFEERIKKIEEEKIDRTISVLRLLAESDTRIAEALKRYNLL